MTPRQARDRRMVKAAVLSLVARGVSYAVVLASIPLSLRYLGPERYGIWATLSTTVAWTLVLDLGLGHALRRRLGAAVVREDRLHVQTEVSTVVAVLCGIAMLLGVALLGTLPLVPWHRVLGARAAEAGEVRRAMAVLLTVVILRLPFLTTGAVYAAYQRGWITAVWDAIASVVGLGALVLIMRHQWGLPALVIAVMGPSLAGSVFSALHLFVVEQPWIRPRWELVRREAILPAMRLGAGFAILQLAALLIHQTDNVIIAHVLGLHSVAVYDVAYRPFWILLTVQSVAMAPLFAAYSEAFVTRDAAWIRRRLWQSVLVCAAFGAILALAVAFFGEPLLEAWTGHALVIDRRLLLSLALWCELYLVTGCYSGFLVGIGTVRYAGWMALLSAPLNIALCVWLGGRYGLEGIAAANSLVLFICAVPTVVESHIRIQRLSAAVAR